MGVAGGRACGLCPKSRAPPTRVPCLLRFTLMVGFSDTFFMVLILFVVSMIAICSRFCSPEGVKGTTNCTVFKWVKKQP